MKDWLTIIILAIAVIFIGGCVYSCTTGSDHRAIAQYVAPASTTEVDRRLIGTGPYWVTKDYRVYYVRTSNNRELWFRFGGILGFDVEESINGKYVKLK